MVFNAVTGKLIRWNDAEDSVPVELDGVSSSAPISVWQNSKETDETITFIFPDAIKTYHGTELMTTEEIDEIDTVNASILSQEGSLWLATSHGAMRYDGETLTTYTTKRDGFLVDNVRDVIEDSRGTIWFATRGGGSVRYDGETFYELTTKDGLAHNNISQIFESSNKDIWFATEKGATQYTPTQGGLPKWRLITLEADKTYTDFSHRLILPSRGAKILNVRGISPLREGLSYQFRLIGLDIPTWTSLSEEEFSLLSTDQGILPDTWASFSTSGLVKQPVKKGGVAQGVQNREGILRVRYTGLKAGNYSFLVKAYRKGWPYTEPPAIIDLSIPPPLCTR